MSSKELGSINVERIQKLISSKEDIDQKTLEISGTEVFFHQDIQNYMDLSKMISSGDIYQKLKTDNSPRGYTEFTDLLIFSAALSTKFENAGYDILTPNEGGRDGSNPNGIIYSILDVATRANLYSFNFGDINTAISEIKANFPDYIEQQANSLTIPELGEEIEVSTKAEKIITKPTTPIVMAKPTPQPEPKPAPQPSIIEEQPIVEAIAPSIKSAQEFVNKFLTDNEVSIGKKLQAKLNLIANAELVWSQVTGAKHSFTIEDKSSALGSKTERRVPTKEEKNAALNRINGQFNGKPALKDKFAEFSSGLQESAEASKSGLAKG